MRDRLAPNSTSSDKARGRIEALHATRSRFCGGVRCAAVKTASRGSNETQSPTASAPRPGVLRLRKNRSVVSWSTSTANLRLMLMTSPCIPALRHFTFQPFLFFKMAVPEKFPPLARTAIEASFVFEFGRQHGHDAPPRMNRRGRSQKPDFHALHDYVEYFTVNRRRMMPSDVAPMAKQPQRPAHGPLVQPAAINLRGAFQRVLRNHRVGIAGTLAFFSGSHGSPSPAPPAREATRRHSIGGYILRQFQRGTRGRIR